MPPPPPLRTGLETFASSGSSIDQRTSTYDAPLARLALDSPGQVFPRTRPRGCRGPRQPERYWGRAGSRMDTVVAVAPASALHAADRSASLPNAGWLTVHARRHQREVSPLSRGVMLQPLSGLLPAGLRLLPPPLPAALSGHLTTSLAVGGQQDNGLATFRRWNRPGGLGRVSPPVVQHLRLEEFGASRPDHVPFGPSLSASLACPI